MLLCTLPQLSIKLETKKQNGSEKPGKSMHKQNPIWVA